MSKIDTMLVDAGALSGGMALASRQRAEGDLVGAVATLERVVLAHPGADAARLIHASLLCRLDDAAGARVEIGQLAGHAVPDAAWAEVTAACGLMPRPMARAR